MKVIRTISEMRAWSHKMRQKDKTVAFVPTMGYLHEGHLSLIDEARSRADAVVASIFVNPTQFAPNEDLDRYPRDFERDEQLCRQRGVSVIFYPTTEEMYPPEHKTYVITEDLSTVLCGRTRPTHFRGVTTIVAKLFNIVQPHIAVFGQKDAQQALIIRRMVEDLNFDIQIVVAPIVREQDGLAMSSRNNYLSPEERAQAVVLSRSLHMAREEFLKGNRNLVDLKQKIANMISVQPLARIDYVEAVDAATLEPLTEAGARPVLLAIAVFFGKTRLIDNTLLAEER